MKHLSILGAAALLLAGTALALTQAPAARVLIQVYGNQTTEQGGDSVVAALQVAF